MTPSPDPAPALAPREPVPVRRFAAFWGIGVIVVGAALFVWFLVSALATIIGLVVVASFFAIVLSPAVDALQARTHIRRGIAVLAVFLAGVVIVGALAYAFARPIYDASSSFSRDLPHTVRDAERGRGEIGRRLKDLGVQKWVRENLPKIRKSLSSTNGPVVSAGKAVVSGAVALVTVLVLTFLILMQAPSIAAFALGLFPERRAQRIRRVGGDAARAVTGYITGNLVISLIAGVAIYLWLLAFGVPFVFVLSLWVAFADLLPLVGATVGAVPAVFVAFLQSPGLGIATLIFFVVYQQFENHVLQTTIMARTVKLNPLGVLLAVLVGVELAGLVGALLAIPAAGAIQVVVRDVWNQRSQSVKQVFSVGTDEHAPDGPLPEEHPGEA
jgi:predicted PurR-regulated permease PerM